MTHLYEVLSAKAQQWREAGYPCENFPVIGEMLDWQTDPETGGLRYLRKPQLKALEVYWYLRVVEGTLRVFDQIEDFISPTIIERLAQQSGVLKPQIEDWRATVDCVMIDPAFDGQVLRVALSDVPAKKEDFVVGTYTLPAPDGPTAVAVKIIDMLGEEVLVTESV